MSQRRPAVSHRGPGLGRAVAAASHQTARQQAEIAEEGQGLVDLQRQLEEQQAREVEEDMSTASASGGGDELVAQLERLGALHREGSLTAEEFASAKSKLLGT